jgi:hypothetical protein
VQRHRVARRLLWLVALVAAWSPAGGPRAALVAEGAPPEEPSVRSASEVVVRGKTTLDLAIRAAVPPTAAGAPAPLVAIVVDVTPNVVQRGNSLMSTLRRLRDDPGFAREIRLTAIGRSLGAAADSPVEFTRDIAAALEAETPVLNTMSELRKSLASLRGPAVAVYVCDWRFEDDFHVDALAAELVRREIVLSVVGTEAAFGRAWTDGSVGPADCIAGRTPITGEYFPGIGRSPFGKPVADAPWHGGDAAYPPVPYRFHEFLWRTEFQKPARQVVLGAPPDVAPGGMDEPVEPPGDDPAMGEPAEEPETPEDLGARLGLPSLADLADSARTYPIPSGFGPYGLMRLAAVTGGRYVLWSWNPGGRARVTYDYGRCNLFGPDLRARERILLEIRTDPLAAATLAAWHALLAADGVVEQTPPLEKDGRTARAIDDVHASTDFSFIWPNLSQWKQFRKSLARSQTPVATARRLLETALSSQKEADGDVGRRRQADALLLLFTVQVLEFELNELDLATRDVKPDLWRTTPKGKTPGVGSRDFIRGAANPLEELGFEIGSAMDAPALDPAAGDRITKARKQHLERFRGTPFAAQVELADISTYRVVEWEEGKAPTRGGSPSESGGVKPGAGLPSPPPGAGSTGGGAPTTGGR